MQWLGLCSAFGGSTAIINEKKTTLHTSSGGHPLGERSKRIEIGTAHPGETDRACIEEQNLWVFTLVDVASERSGPGCVHNA